MPRRNTALNESTQTSRRSKHGKQATNDDILVIDMRSLHTQCHPLAASPQAEPANPEVGGRDHNNEDCYFFTPPQSPVKFIKDDTIGDCGELCFFPPSPVASCGCRRLQAAAGDTFEKMVVA